MIQAYERAAAIASESIAAVRTVASFAAEDKVEERFLQALTLDSAGVKQTAFGAGLGQVSVNILSLKIFGYKRSNAFSGLFTLHNFFPLLLWFCWRFLFDES